MEEVRHAHATQSVRGALVRLFERFEVHAALPITVDKRHV